MACGEKRPVKGDIQIFILISQKRMLVQLGKTLGEAGFGEMVAERLGTQFWTN